MTKLNWYLGLLMMGMSLGVLPLVGCQEGPLEDAGEQVDDAAEDVADGVEDAVDKLD